MERRQDAIANFVSGLGDPEHDSTLLSKPIVQNRLTPIELDVLYTQNDLAGIIIDEIIEDVFRAGWTVTDASEDDVELATSRDVKEAIRDVLKNARLYGGGALMIVIDDGKDPEQPAAPENASGIVNLVPLDRWEIDFDTEDFNSDVTDENFGEPEYFKVTPDAPGGTVQTKKVHRSRIVKIDGRELTNRIQRRSNHWGDSILQRVWNNIQRFYQTESGISNVVEDYETGVVSISGLDEILSQEDGRDKIKERLELMEASSDLVKAVLLDKDAGESYEKQTSSVSGLDRIWGKFALSIAKAARMPMVKLFGQTPAGLNTDGESSKENWRKQVASFRERKVERMLERIVELGQPSVDYSISFGELKELTKQTKADVRLKTAKTDKIYHAMGVRTSDQIAKSRDRPKGWSGKTKPRTDLFRDVEERELEALNDLDARLEGGLDTAPREDIYSGAGDENLPPEVQALDEDSRSQWVAVFNETLDSGESESDAFQAAWTAVSGENGDGEQ